MRVCRSETHAAGAALERENVHVRAAAPARDERARNAGCENQRKPKRERERERERDEPEMTEEGNATDTFKRQQTRALITH